MGRIGRMGPMPRAPSGAVKNKTASLLSRRRLRRSIIDRSAPRNEIVPFRTMDPQSPPIRWEPTACPLCGGRESLPLVEAPEPDGPPQGPVFQIVACRECGLCYTNPRPDAASLARFYRPDYGPHRGCGLSPGPARPAAGPGYPSGCGRAIRSGGAGRATGRRGCWTSVAAAANSWSGCTSKAGE